MLVLGRLNIFASNSKNSVDCESKEVVDAGLRRHDVALASARSNIAGYFLTEVRRGSPAFAGDDGMQAPMAQFIEVFWFFFSKKNSFL